MTTFVCSQLMHSVIWATWTVSSCRLVWVDWVRQSHFLNQFQLFKGILPIIGMQGIIYGKLMKLKITAFKIPSFSVAMGALAVLQVPIKSVFKFCMHTGGKQFLCWRRSLVNQTLNRSATINGDWCTISHSGLLEKQKCTAASQY